VTYKWIAGAALIALASQPAPAATVDGATQSDVECVAALSVAASEAEGEQLTDLAMITFYFIGRLDGRVPALDIESALAGEAPGLTESRVKALVTSCSAQYLKRANEMQEVGKSLERRAREKSSTSS